MDDLPLFNNIMVWWLAAGPIFAIWAALAMGGIESIPGMRGTFGSGGSGCLILALIWPIGPLAVSLFGWVIGLIP